VLAPAEALPLEDASADGAVFAGVLPFTEEDRALSELARVLRPGGRVEAYYLGPGYGLRDLLVGRTLRKRYYGLRALVNTALATLVGRKLPGKYGDVVYVTHGRLADLYGRHGFELRTHTPSPTFLGLPVFIYHAAERVGGAAPAPRRTAPAPPDAAGGRPLGDARAAGRNFVALVAGMIAGSGAWVPLGLTAFGPWRRRRRRQSVARAAVP
jgi:SAM-dependent methyltransferase